MTQFAIDTGATGGAARQARRIHLFAPNDRAFEVTANNLGLLGKKYRYSAKVDEKRVYEALKPLGNDVIAEILLYHVIPNAKVTGKQVLSGPFTQRVQMANQENLRITVLSRSAKYPVIVLGDKDGRVLNDLVVRPGDPDAEHRGPQRERRAPARPRQLTQRAGGGCDARRRLVAGIPWGMGGPDMALRLQGLTKFYEANAASRI
ncbi:MAG: fasciclin domain-containing protein [Candidatus Nanopelagicales bacterium]